MAFQAPNLVSRMAATVETSMANALCWRTLKRNAAEQTRSFSAQPVLKQAGISNSRSPSFQCNEAMKNRVMGATTSRRTFAAAGLMARPALMEKLAQRSFSTSIYRTVQPLSTSPKFPNRPQRRTFFGNTSVLAHLEETANKNPTSATAQNAFYQALLRANMPAIIAERYQTGQFASNESCYAAYQKALGLMGQSEPNAMNNYQGQSQGQHFGQGQQGLNNGQLQAIGQAVAASTQGGNISHGKNNVNSTGAKDSPLYVVVDESIGSVIFKWVKFLFYFGLVTYISMVIVTMIVDSLSVLKGKAGIKVSNEAKPEHQKARFSDVHGCDEAKEELQEVVDFLKNPEKFSTLGGKLPKGVLLVGPPGTGKTLLARAVAGEAGVPFFFMSGSEFDEMYVGVGAKRVRELFGAAKEKAPSIVFIDELDAIGGKRSGKDMAYVKQTLNQLLTELDGFEQNSGVIILGATNFPDSLDKALTRPGRFDRNVVVGLPDVRGRVAILEHHIKNVTVANDVQLEVLAAGTPGFSGAELENVINQAAVHASKAKKTAVSMLDFEWAKDKVMMGAEKRSMIISPDEKKTTAYHEAGHALVAMFTPGAMKLHKITIMPRGMALGITHFLPEMDKYSMEAQEYKASIDVSMGGKIAEELIYGPDKVTSGVSADLQNATRVAYAMVTQFGMSDKLGNVDLYSNHDTLSSETKHIVESEVRRMVEEGRIRATAILESKRKELDLLAKALIEYETIDKVEAYKVIKGEKLDRPPVLSIEAPIKVPEITSTGTGGPPGLGGIIPPIPGSAGAASGTNTGGSEPPTPASGLAG